MPYTEEQIREMFAQAAQLAGEAFAEARKNGFNARVDELDKKWNKMYDAAVAAREAAGFSKHIDGMR